jgi:Na+/H+-dicarboxylate symporter
MSYQTSRRIFLLFFGAILGTLIGLIWGEAAAPIGIIGDGYIKLIKAFAAPLLFFAIVDGIISTELKLKGLLPMFSVFIINGIFAVIIGLSVANIFEPGLAITPLVKDLKSSQFTENTLVSTNLSSLLQSIIPSSIFDPFNSNNILAIVLIALLIGFAARTIKNKSYDFFALLQTIASGGTHLFEKILLWLVELTPLAIGAVLAKVIGSHGLDSIQSLMYFLGFGALALLLQVILVYQSWLLFCRISLGRFWKLAIEPSLYSFGVNSSLATLPLTLRSLDLLGVRKEASRLAACVGTNFNNDGILLYEAFVVIVIAQAFGIPLTIVDQLWIAGICVIVSMGVGGIPEAGIIALSLILTTLKMPLEILPLLLTVDWILARLRSVTNIIADMTCGVILNRLPQRMLQD